MKFDACEYCGGKVTQRRVTVDVRHGERLYVVRNVPVGVCAKCGERYYPGPLLEQLDEIVCHGLHGARTVRVPTVDFAATA